MQASTALDRGEGMSTCPRLRPLLGQGIRGESLSPICQHPM